MFIFVVNFVTCDFISIELVSSNKNAFETLLMFSYIKLFHRKISEIYQNFLTKEAEGIMKEFLQIMNSKTN